MQNSRPVPAPARVPGESASDSGDRRIPGINAGEGRASLTTLPVGLASIRSHFPAVTPSEAAQVVIRDFARLTQTTKHTHRARKVVRAKGSRDETSFGLYTQNVSGLASGHSKAGDWFGHLRQRGVWVQHDIAFLQETHCTKKWSEDLGAAHARSWGYDPNTSTETWSLWSISAGRSGGLSILLNPFAGAAGLEPFREELWSAHWMAAKARIHGVEVLLVNIYAPSQRTEREAFFKQLECWDLSFDGLTFVGGDFNCTLHPDFDRSHAGARDARGSPALVRLMQSRGWVDVYHDMIDESERSRGAGGAVQRHHTYYYTGGDGKVAAAV